MLEIHVFDQIRIASTLEEALSIIEEAFKKWVDSGGKKRFSISVKKMANKAPPALGISVSDGIKTKEAIG